METLRKSYRYVLAAGDVVIFIVFTALGRLSHGMDVASGGLLVTAIPFIVAWVPIASLLGAYSVEALGSSVSMLTRTTLSWVIACPLGVGLRALILRVPFSIPFAAVTLGLAGLMLLVWRIPYGMVAGRSLRADEHSGRLV